LAIFIKGADSKFQISLPSIKHEILGGIICTHFGSLSLLSHYHKMMMMMMTKKWGGGGEANVCIGIIVNVRRDRMRGVSGK
jgi:hypothetical protein